MGQYPGSTLLRLDVHFASRLSTDQKEHVPSSVMECAEDGLRCAVHLHQQGQGVILPQATKCSLS